MNSSDQIQSHRDDQTALTEARNMIETARLWVETELDRSKLGSVANDVLESLHHELENRVASLGAALNELEDELGAMDDGTDEHRRDLYSNLGVGRTAA